MTLLLAWHPVPARLFFSPMRRFAGTALQKCKRLTRRAEVFSRKRCGKSVNARVRGGHPFGRAVFGLSNMVRGRGSAFGTALFMPVMESKEGRCLCVTHTKLQHMATAVVT